jgi:RHS repeat-associated protein
MGRLQTDQCVTFYYDTNPFDDRFSQNAKDRLAAVQWGVEGTGPGLMMEMYSYTYTGKREAKRLSIKGRGVAVALDLIYTYDGNGRISTIQYPQGGPKLEYTYDEKTGRPTQLMNGKEMLVKDAEYDALSGRLISYKQLVPGTGKYLKQSRVLNSKLQVSGIKAGFERDANLLVDLEYEYDDAQRVSHETDYVSNEVTEYEYDASSRLKRASRWGKDEWELGYDFDGFANRESQKKNKGSAPELASAYDAATNQVLGASAAYDANGNIVKLFDMDLRFDAQNRLVSIERKGKGAEQYGYNPGNLRIWKKLATGEEEIHFYGDGCRRLATYRLTRDRLGIPSLTLIDSDIFFAGKLLSSNDKPVVLDRLGSVRAWIDSQSNVERTKYYPFGEERQVTRNDRRKFTTYIRDSFSELDYAEQRYYSSALGRFITPDPYAGSVQLGNPDTWNRYAYVNNDPVNKTDPHGLDSSPYPQYMVSGFYSWYYDPIALGMLNPPGSVNRIFPVYYTGEVVYWQNEQYHQADLVYHDYAKDPVWRVPPGVGELYVKVRVYSSLNYYVADPYSHDIPYFPGEWRSYLEAHVDSVNSPPVPVVSKPQFDGQLAIQIPPISYYPHTYWLDFGYDPYRISGENRTKGGAGTIAVVLDECLV